MNENCSEINEPMRQLEICQTSEQQNKDIFVPNWLPEALGWIGRAKLANSSLSYSCRLFKQLCWPKLHGNVKPYLVSILEFTESHNRAKLQRNGEEIPIAVSPPPNYILGFRRIYIFYYLDDQIVEFFKNVLHLFDNTQIQFAEDFYSLEDRTSIHICWIRLLTLLSQSNIFSDLSILHYHDFQKFNELFPDMIDNFQSLSLGRLNGLDIIYHWLLKPRSDGKQKILHFDGYYYNLLCLNLKQEFRNSQQPSKYCVYAMERCIEFKMENAQTGEILESFYKERDGGIPTYYLVRYPKGEEHWKEIREKNNCPFSAIYSNSINIGPNI